MWNALPSPTPYVLRATATDTYRAVCRSEPVRVIITAPPPNLPPKVQLIAPTNGATFTGPTNILVVANASDPDGQVARVDFFVGDLSIGSVTAPPYSVVWNGVVPGCYVLTAKATDDRGAMSVSTPVRVTVTPTAQASVAKRELPPWYVPGVRLPV